MTRRNPEPTWVMARLTQLGLPARRNGPAPMARPSGRVTARWHGCGRPVLTGVAFPWAITLDPCPVTPEGELFAILSGRPTVELVAWLGDGELLRRRASLIGSGDADEVPVLIAHVCGGPYAAANPRWAPPASPTSDRTPF